MMKKLAKLLIAGLLAAVLAFSVVACTPTDPPDIPEIPEPGGEKVSINDAYDWNEDKTGSTRPDFGGGYTPTLPPTSALLTIAPDCSVRFKDGGTQMTLPVGTLLKQSDFDESTLAGGDAL